MGWSTPRLGGEFAVKSKANSADFHEQCNVLYSFLQGRDKIIITTLLLPDATDSSSVSSNEKPTLHSPNCLGCPREKSEETLFDSHLKGEDRLKVIRRLGKESIFLFPYNGHKEHAKITEVWKIRERSLNHCCLRKRCLISINVNSERPKCVRLGKCHWCYYLVVEYYRCAKGTYSSRWLYADLAE